jgi:large subunit ribosomal protein L15
MLKIDALKPTAGARRRRRRVGRGLGSGSGVYAGRGRKGQKARAGKGPRPGFEGGQTPLSKRLPFRRGVRAAGSVMTGGPPRVRPAEVSVRALTGFPAGSEVTVATLVEAGLVDRGPVKVLGGGRLAYALVVKAQAFSKSAKQAIEAAGGKAEIVR